MGMIYTAEIANQAVSAAQDLFEITAPSDAAVKVLSCRIGQRSQEGDAEAEMAAIAIARYTGADGVGGNALTPLLHELGYAAAGSSVRGNTTEGATKTRMLSDAFNLQAGWLYLPPPQEVIVLSPDGKLAIYLPAALSGILTFDMSFTFEEIGG